MKLASMDRRIREIWIPENSSSQRILEKPGIVFLDVVTLTKLDRNNRYPVKLGSGSLFS